MLDPVSKGFHARDVTYAFIILCAYPLGVLFNEEVVKEARFDVKFNCVICSRHCLDIPLDIIILLNFLDVV